jgi:hypothetical protein
MVSPSLFLFPELLRSPRPVYGAPFPMALFVAPDNNAPADSHRITTPLFGLKPSEIDGLLQTALTGIAN